MKWIIYFIMLGALVGCVHQTMLSSGAARHIQNITVYKGKTTENDIIAVLGQPESRREQMENGKITTRLSYGYFEDTGVYVNFTVCETNGACMTNLVGPVRNNRIPRPVANALHVTFIQNGALIETFP